MIQQYADRIYLAAGMFYVVFCVVIAITALLARRPREALIAVLFAAANWAIFCWR